MIGVRSRWAWLVVTVVAAFAAALPAARAAPVASLSTPLSCLNYDPSSQQTFPVYGSGFPAKVTVYVRLASDPYGEVVTSTDARGNLAVRIKGSSSWSARPSTDTIEAREPSTQHPPQLLATVRVAAVSQGATLTPLRSAVIASAHARLRAVLGGAPGGSIYVHWWFRASPRAVNKRLIRTVRLGALAGPCGAGASTFSILGRVRARPGLWAVGVDRYRHPRHTADRISAGIGFQVRRWDGRGSPPIPHLRRGGLFVLL